MLEKAESIALEVVCAVRSSKAAGLERIKLGYYHPPGGPPVSSQACSGSLSWWLGCREPPTLAAMRWWTSRGRLAGDRRRQITSLLSQYAIKWSMRIW